MLIRNSEDMRDFKITSWGKIRSCCPFKLSLLALWSYHCFSQRVHGQNGSSFCTVETMAKAWMKQITFRATSFLKPRPRRAGPLSDEVVDARCKHAQGRGCLGKQFCPFRLAEHSYHNQRMSNMLADRFDMFGKSRLASRQSFCLSVALLRDCLLTDTLTYKRDKKKRAGWAGRCEEDNMKTTAWPLRWGEKEQLKGQAGNGQTEKKSETSHCGLPLCGQGLPGLSWWPNTWLKSEIGGILRLKVRERESPLWSEWGRRWTEGEASSLDSLSLLLSPIIVRMFWVGHPSWSRNNELCINN